MRALLALCLTLPAWGQNGKLLLTPDEFAQDWATSSKFTLEVASAMPAAKYSFKATSEEMTFGELMLHIANAQVHRVFQVSGEKSPPVGSRTDAAGLTKDEIIAKLRASFDYVIATLPKLTPEQLAKSYPVAWRDRPNANGRQIILGMFVHTAHHRAQAEVYLRLNGITPPEYEF